jgi:acyl-CoA synthetase (AMP-forming)/AMP-acid ligase II
MPQPSRQEAANLPLAPSTEELRAGLRASWRRSGWHRGINLADAVSQCVQLHGADRVRFTAEDHARDLSISELVDESARVATVLAELGVRPGDAIALHVPSWPEGISVLCAGLWLRATVVPIPGIYRPAEVEFILEDAKVSTYVMASRWRQHDYTEELAKVSHASQLERVIVIGDPVPGGCIAWSEIAERARRSVPMSVDRFRCPATELAFVVYTSGSTAKPKGVRHSSDTMLAEFAQGWRQFGKRGVFLEGFPAGHMGGLIAALRPLIYGRQTVMLDHWDADLAAHLVDDLKVTSATGPPFYLTTLLEAAEQNGLDLSSIGDFSTGGSGVPAVLIERANDAGVLAYRTYGSTEHSTVATNVPTDTLSDRSRTDGLVMEGAALRILDDEDRVLPRGREGEVIIRGPDQFLGYTDDNANRAAFTSDGWFRTGDLGLINDDGRLVISGRKKDIIIRGGEKLSSEEIEDVLARHPAVSHVAVVGLADARYGERACAFVILREGSTLTLDEVKEHFHSADVARQKTPEKLVIKSEFPRTPAGKVRKNALREQLERGDL